MLVRCKFIKRASLCFLFRSHFYRYTNKLVGDHKLANIVVISQQVLETQMKPMNDALSLGTREK